MSSASPLGKRAREVDKLEVDNPAKVGSVSCQCVRHLSVGKTHLPHLLLFLTVFCHHTRALSR